MATMFVWKKEKGSWGHTSLALNDKTYISWWPQKDKSKHNLKKKKYNGITKQDLPVDYEDERDHFIGREYTCRYSIRNKDIDVEKIREWWIEIKKEGGYHFLFNNCCDLVVQALRVGGFPIPNSLIRTPADMVGIGRRLRRWNFLEFLMMMIGLAVFK